MTSREIGGEEEGVRERRARERKKVHPCKVVCVCSSASVALIPSNKAVRQ